MRGRRNRTYFTPEQCKALQDNPYTEMVTSCQIRYTAEFKEMFWERYSSGESVKNIFQDAGYDIGTLGESRIYNFSHQLAAARESGRAFSEEHHDDDKYADKAKITAMEHELIYLRQEIEFLKKISLLERQSKQKR